MVDKCSKKSSDPESYVLIPRKAKLWFLERERQLLCLAMSCLAQVEQKVYYHHKKRLVTASLLTGQI